MEIIRDFDKCKAVRFYERMYNIQIDFAWYQRNGKLIIYASLYIIMIGKISDGGTENPSGGQNKIIRRKAI